MITILYTYIEEEKQQYLLDQYLNAFSSEIKKKILRSRRWEDAQSSLLGKILLKIGMKKYFNIDEFEINYTSTNKPYLRNYNIYFNISHSKNIVVCAMSNFPIGIDIEYIDQEIKYIDFKSYMTDNEYDKINSSIDTIKSFFIYWTEKESVIKAHGGGMFIPLQKFEVSENETIIDGSIFYLKEVLIDKAYQCCIATVDNIDQNKIYIDKINMKHL